MRIRRLLSTLFIFSLLVSACSTAATQNPTQGAAENRLTPFSTATLTPTITPTPKNAPTATPVPTATPTPIIYVVREKDTMGVIAYNHGLTVDELKAANPDVDPYMMPVGTKLIIPFPKTSPLTPSPLEATTVPVQVVTTECLPAASGGLYCFAQVTNEHETALTNFSAEFQLTDTQSGTVTTQKALLPISQLQADASLPLYAYFAPPTAKEYTIALNILTATNVEGTPGSMPGITPGEPEIAISTDGFSAAVSGEVVVGAGAEGTKTLTVTAVSYDDQGKVNGIRRLDVGVDAANESPVPYSLSVYSVRGVIARVSVFVEARP